MEKKRLLVVEDDAMSRRAWQTIFGRRGWEVLAAGTVAEGLALLDPAPDYLILDLRLPDGGGEEVLRKVRDGGLKTRVAVTTGVNDPRQRGLVDGLCPEALFEKPVNVADLWRETG
jgi:ActR/RegA family two-component response regulator